MQQKLNEILKDLYVISNLVPIATLIPSGNLADHVCQHLESGEWAANLIRQHVSNWRALDPETNRDELSSGCLSYLCVATLDYSKQYAHQLVQSVVHDLSVDPNVPPTFVDLVCLERVPLVGATDPDTCQLIVGAASLAVVHPNDKTTRTRIRIRDTALDYLIDDPRSWLYKRLKERSE